MNWGTSYKKLREVIPMKIGKYSMMFLKKLRNFTGGKHTAEEHVLRLLKWLPPKERKKADKEYNSLIKSGYILVKPTHYGRQVSLNPKIKKKFFG